MFNPPDPHLVEQVLIALLQLTDRDGLKIWLSTQDKLLLLAHVQSAVINADESTKTLFFSLGEMKNV